ncbi:hypothetical protein B0H13DRAFT_2667899 [Mycena leptocephala]|nr:hypothetical protein B0H13DRAFT_2667899 [Mycena leptocephala]
MAHATLTSPSFSCGRLFYRSSVAPLDIYVEAILMRIAQLCATFPLTLRRYDRLVLFVHDDFWHCLRMALAVSASTPHLDLIRTTPTSPPHYPAHNTMGAALTPSSCALSVLSCTRLRAWASSSLSIIQREIRTTDTAALPIRHPLPRRRPLGLRKPSGATRWAPIAACVRRVRLSRSSGYRASSPSFLSTTSGCLQRLAPVVSRCPVHPPATHLLLPPVDEWGRNQAPAAAAGLSARLSRTPPAAHLPSSPRRGGTRWTRSSWRGCPALLQLCISLPPLDEVGRDGLGPRAPLHPHRVPPLSLAVGGMLRPKRITGRTQAPRAARRFDVVVHDAQRAADVCRVLGSFTTTRAAGEQGRARAKTAGIANDGQDTRVAARERQCTRILFHYLRFLGLSGPPSPSLSCLVAISLLRFSCAPYIP